MRRIHTTASLTALLLLCLALSRHSFAAAAWPALPDLTAFLMLRTEAGKSPSLIRGLGWCEAEFWQKTEWWKPSDCGWPQKAV